VPERVASWLLQQADDTSANSAFSFEMWASREELVQLLGTSRESVCCALAQFRRDGHLEQRGHHWTVKDRVALEAFCRA